MISGGRELSHTLLIYALAIKLTIIEQVKLLGYLLSRRISCYLMYNPPCKFFFHFWLPVTGTRTACWIILSACTRKTWSAIPHLPIDRQYEAHSGSPQILAKTTKPGQDPKRFKQKEHHHHFKKNCHIFTHEFIFQLGNSKQHMHYQQTEVE